MIRSTSFLRAYRALPHVAINRCGLAVARQQSPGWLVQSAVRSWIRRDGIDMRDFEPGPYRSLQEFFLRRLRPGARPLGEGIVAPVDGCVVGTGRIERGTILQVKGHPISVDALVNGERASKAEGRLHDLSLDAYEGGTYLTLFLRPRGYHFVHAPCDLTVEDVRWIPGRFFPQNEDALRHVPRIYERNERAVLRVRCEGEEGKEGKEGEERAMPALMVMVGASVIGGIQVTGVPNLRRQGASPLARRVDKGVELGHFDFGSTVVMLMPREASVRPAVTMGQEVLMGERIFTQERSS